MENYKLDKCEKWLEEKCPCCGWKLVEIYEWNPEIFGTDVGNKKTKVCRNEKCKGWFCEYCNEWHSYLTCCSVVMVRNVRRGTNYPMSYKEWKERKDFEEWRKKNVNSKS